MIELPPLFGASATFWSFRHFLELLLEPIIRWRKLLDPPSVTFCDMSQKAIDTTGSGPRSCGVSVHLQLVGSATLVLLLAPLLLFGSDWRHTFTHSRNEYIIRIPQFTTIAYTLICRIVISNLQSRMLAISLFLCQHSEAATSTRRLHDQFRIIWILFCNPTRNFNLFMFQHLLQVDFSA